MTALTVRSRPKGRLPTLRRVRSFVDEATTPILCHEQSSKDKESTAFPEIDISVTTKCGCHTSSCTNFCLHAAEQATYNDASVSVCFSMRCCCYRYHTQNGSLQNRQDSPFQTSCFQSTNSKPISVTHSVLHWLTLSPNLRRSFKRPIIRIS